LLRLGLVPEAQRSADMLPLIMPALRADLELVVRHRHRPDAPLTCPILALLGTHDGVIRRDQVLGWAAHTDADFVLRRVPGGHLCYREAPAETWRVLAPLLAGSR
jgi:surfactin synthase thioesterase subunit